MVEPTKAGYYPTGGLGGIPMKAEELAKRRVKAYIGIGEPIPELKGRQTELSKSLQALRPRLSEEALRKIRLPDSQRDLQQQIPKQLRFDRLFSGVKKVRETLTITPLEAVGRQIVDRPTSEIIELGREQRDREERFRELTESFEDVGAKELETIEKLESKVNTEGYFTGTQKELEQYNKAVEEYQKKIEERTKEIESTGAQVGGMSTPEGEQLFFSPPEAETVGVGILGIRKEVPVTEFTAETEEGIEYQALSTGVGLLGEQVGEGISIGLQTRTPFSLTTFDVRPPKEATDVIGQGAKYLIPYAGEVFFASDIERETRQFGYNPITFAKEEPLQAAILGGTLLGLGALKGLEALKGLGALKGLKTYKTGELFGLKVGEGIKIERQPLIPERNILEPVGAVTKSTQRNIYFNPLIGKQTIRETGGRFLAIGEKTAEGSKAIVTTPRTRFFERLYRKIGVPEKFVQTGLGKPIYGGNPFKNFEEYKKALKLLEKQGYTESQARNLLRLRQPKVRQKTTFGDVETIATEDSTRAILTGKSIEGSVTGTKGGVKYIEQKPELQLLKDISKPKGREQVKILDTDTIKIRDLNKNLREFRGSLSKQDRIKFDRLDTQSQLFWEGQVRAGSTGGNIYRGELKSLESIKLKDLPDKGYSFLAKGGYLRKKKTTDIFSRNPLKKKEIITGKEDLINVNVFEFQREVKTLGKSEGKTTELFGGYTGARQVKEYPQINFAQFESAEISKGLNPLRRSKEFSTGKVFIQKGEPQITIVDESVLGSKGFSGRGKQSSDQFLEQLYKTDLDEQVSGQVLDLIKTPKTPKTSKTTTIQETTTTPTESIWAGTGLYERTSGGGALSIQSSDQTTLTGISQPSLLNTKTRTDTTIRTFQDIKPRLDTKLDTKPALKLFSDTKPALTTRTRLKETQVTKQKQRQLTKQKTKPLLRETLRTKTSNKNTIKTKNTSKRHQRQKLPLFKKPKEKKKKLLFDEDLFEVFVRKKGEDISIGEFKTLPQAETTLKSKLTKTLRASGFITKGEEKIRPDLGKFGMEFRMGKTDPFRIVQKAPRRLGRKGETKEIQFFRKQKGSGGLI